jgi:hypothetical protein
MQPRPHAPYAQKIEKHQEGAVEYGYIVQLEKVLAKCAAAQYEQET